MNYLAHVVEHQGNAGTKSATTGTTFTISQAGAFPTAVGDVAIIVVAIPSSSVSVSQITDAGGNSYSRINASISGALTVEVWTATLISTPPGTTTVTLSATGTLAAGTTQYYRNVASIQASTNINGAASPITTGSQTLTQNNSILVLGGATAAASTYTATNGQVRTTTTATGISVVSMDSQGQVTPVTVAATFTTTAWVGVYFELTGLAATPQGGGPITFNWAQETDPGNNVTATTLTLTSTAGNSISAGDLIVAVWRTTQKGGVITINDTSNSGNYTEAFIQDEASTQTGEIGVFYFPSSVAVAGGSFSATVTTTATAGFCYFAILVYHGALNNSNVLDTFASQAYSGVIPGTQIPESTFATPAAINELVVAVFSEPQGSTAALGQEALGFTSRLNNHLGTGTYGHCHVADRIISDTTSLEYLGMVSVLSSLNTPIVGIALFIPALTGDTVSLTGAYKLQ